jgi:hypothetical protein
MLWEENNRKKNEENILKLILEKKKKLKKITSSFRIISYFFKSALTQCDQNRKCNQDQGFRDNVFHDLFLL